MQRGLLVLLFLLLLLLLLLLTIHRLQVSKSPALQQFENELAHVETVKFNQSHCNKLASTLFSSSLGFVTEESPKHEHTQMFEEKEKFFVRQTEHVVRFLKVRCQASALAEFHHHHHLVTH